MKRKRNQRGFTMAELLIVVAIIGVLAGVAFVAVQTHQESLNQVELDTVAKEIFVAAQNHLTMARNEGYMGLIEYSPGLTDEEDDDYGTREDVTPFNGVYYYSVQNGSATANIFNLMLPPYALDGTALAGNYIVRYQPSSGLVLDVFYASPTGKYARTLDNDDYSEAMGLTGDDKKNARRRAHIGWYGGTEAASLPKGDPLEAPVLEVENGERLIAKITDKNTDRTDYKIALLVTGKASQAQQVFRIGDKSDDNADRITGAAPYEIILDDITTDGMHFAEIGTANIIEFIPGEDIVLRAVAYNETALSNIANSDEKTVNSLFERADNASLDITDAVKDQPCVPIKAYINNIRHLENLSYAVSKVNYSPVSSKIIAAGGTGPATLIVKAEQTTDLEWGKGDRFTASAAIYTVDSTDGGGGGNFLPINVPDKYKVMPDDDSAKVNSSISYDGKHHSIKGITVNVTGAASAGLFGDLPNDSSVKDLALIDFTVTSASGSAGALAGTLKQNDDLPQDSSDTPQAIPNVSNVVAYNTGNAATATITSSGDAGGLIGKVTGGKDKDGNEATCTAVIEKSAAALVVTSTGGNAGGLIGSMEGGTLTDCYSGGHTKDGEYYNGTTPIYNVTATAGTAGGLIGVATNMGNVANCYSTCSATGKVAGGFAGTYAGTSEASLGNCYATGLVCGTETEAVSLTIGSGDSATTKAYTAVPKDGALAYSLTGLTAAEITGCSYYEIINERVERETSGESSKTYAISATKPSGSMTSADSVAYLTAFGKLNVDGKDAENNLYNVTALDASAGDYNTFVGAPDTWNKAAPYDGTLLKYYSVGIDDDSKPDTDDVMEARYNLKGIKRLDATVTDDYFVATHYGDWPAPEIFVLNTPTP